MEAEKLDPVLSYLNDFKLFTTGKNFWQASLLKQLEGLSYIEALYLPAPDRHCIWEIVRHIAYWKYWALTYVKDGVALEAKEHNWKALPEDQSEASWQNEISKLRELNDECIDVINSLGNALLESTEEKIVFFRQLLYHDCYHTGQIGMLRAMQEIKPVT
ncbi:MAG: DinB family protein [Ignavibacteria bacterium]|nr:DinB family protein [Ignavibacteria bacterium]